MAHMRAQEHDGYYDCIRAGTARTSATIAAAIAAIGGAASILNLTFAGDGVWTITSNLTIPSNIVLQVPPGVTVFRNSGVTLTIQGVVVAAETTWETGPGTTVRNASALTEITGLAATHAIITQPAAGSGLEVQSSSAAGARRVRIFTDQGGGNPGISLGLVDNDAQQTYQLYCNTAGNLTWARPAAAWTMCLTSTTLGIGPNFSPSASFYLQLSGDFAAKPGAGGLWTVPSSAQLKEVGDPYTDGMDLIRQLPEAREAVYNGLAGMPEGQAALGYVAEELQAVAPALVRPFHAKLRDEDADETDLLGVNLGPLLYVMVNALKELDTRLSTMEGQVPPEADADTHEPEDRPTRSHRRRKD